MRENYKPATCHPEKRHAARGLCFMCYRKQYPAAKRASCHPDRVAHAHGVCRVCYDRDLKESDPAYALRQRENYQAWSATHQEHLSEYSKKAKRNPRMKLRDSLSKRRLDLAKYGLSWEDEQVILARQSNGCAICRAKPDRLFLDLDHDHTTGKFRGLICGRCNKGLGLLGDSLERLRNAVAYLEGSNGESI